MSSDKIQSKQVKYSVEEINDLLDKINNISINGENNIDLNKYALKSDLFSKNYNDLTNKPIIPSIEGLAKESFVIAKIAEAQLNGDGGDIDLSGYALKSDLSKYALKSDLFNKDYNALINKPTIPSIEGLASKLYVDSEIARIQQVDENRYALKSDFENLNALVKTLQNQIAQLENRILVLENNGGGDEEPVIVYGQIVLNKTSISVNEKGTATFTVKLDKAPTQNQIVNISINNSNATINKTSLTFTSSNYNTAQSITVTGAHLSSDYTNKTATITLSSSNVSNKTIAVTINNIDSELSEPEGLDIYEPGKEIQVAEKGFAINGNLDGKSAFRHMETYIPLAGYEDKAVMWSNNVSGWTMVIYYDSEGTFKGHKQWERAETQLLIKDIINAAPSDSVYFRVSVNQPVTSMSIGEPELPEQDMPGLDTSSFKIDLGNAPYISLAYVEPIIMQGETQTINVYVTDSTQKEFRHGDTSEKFDIYYSVDGGTPKVIQGASAGDNNIVLSSLSTGEHEVEIFAVDSKNVISHKLYPKFKVKASRSSNPKIITDSDLATYGINKNGSTDATAMTNTRTGLQRLLNEMHNQGYDKIILPKGTYMVNVIDGNSYINMPNNMTLDLNGSTIQQAPFELDQAATFMFMFNGVEDSHIINGTLKGDYETRTLTGNNGEHAGLIQMRDNCKYCSIEDATIRDSVGYTCMSEFSSMYGSNKALSNYTAVTINSNGAEVANDNMATSDYADISNQRQFGWIVLGRFLGWRGTQGTSFCIAHFYDSNKNYIRSEYAQMYRKIKMPENAYYVRATFKSAPSAIAGTLCAYTPKVPYGGLYRGVTFYHTRTCAIAFTAMNNFMVDDCIFDNCGHSITPAAIDLEDGWDQMQDCTFRGCEVTVPAGTIDMIICGGYNIRIINNKNFRGGVRNRTIDSLIAGNTLNNFSTSGRFARVSDNTFNGTLTVDVFENGQTPVEETFKQIIVRDSIWKKALCYVGNSGLGSLKFINCEYDYENASGSGDIFVFNNAILEDCTIKNYTYNKMHINNNKFINCDFTNVKSTIFRGNNEIEGGSLTNCNLGAWSADTITSVSFSGTKLTNSCLEPASLGGGTHKFSFNNCTVNNTSCNLYNGDSGPLTDLTLTNNNINCGSNDIIYFKSGNANHPITAVVTNNKLNTSASVFNGVSSALNENNTLTITHSGNSGYTNLIGSGLNQAYITK